MATSRLQFALPYAPETQIGRAIGSVSTALFGGPTAFERDKMANEADLAKAKLGLAQGELQGRTTIADRIAQWTSAMSDPAQREAAFRTYAPGIAEDAARAGYDPSKAVDLFRLSLATPATSEQNRAYGTYATKGEVSPFQSFGDINAQKAAEGRQTAQKVSVATSGAAAANPDKYQLVAERKAILADQPPNSPDRRVLAGFESRPGPAEGEKTRAASNLGLDPTEAAQLDALNKHFSMAYKSAFGSGIDWDAAKKDPGYTRWSELNRKMASSINRPPVEGFRPDPASPNLGMIPSQKSPGRMIRVEKDPVSNKWYAHETDGKVYPIER